jgi:hypothetical protein
MRNTRMSKRRGNHHRTGNRCRSPEESKVETEMLAREVLGEPNRRKGALESHTNLY